MFRILFILLLFSSSFAHAKDEPKPSFPAGNYAELAETGMAQVESVIDPQTVRLADGTIVRLTGIEFPDFNPDNPGEFSLLALEVLKDMLTGKNVVLHQSKNKDEGRVNRMGQILAQIERRDDHAWVQGSLLSLGLGRVQTTRTNSGMAQQMYDLEDEARKAKAGIWDGGAYKVLTPEETKDRIGSFQIAEGRIVSATMKQNRVYLNFGQDWRSDFTVSIAPEDKRVFSKAGIDPLQWNNKTIRVRGWLENYNGPLIQIDHPEQIEIPETDGK